MKKNRADQYIQLCVCVCIIVVLVAGVISFASLFSSKLWLNDRLSDMTRKISVTGNYKDAEVVEMQQNITDRLGGDFTFTGDIMNSETGTVQLGDVLHINYKSKIKVFAVGDVVINTDVNINRDAISEVYFKDE